MEQLDETMEEARKLLAAFSNKAAAFIIAPAMTSSKVVAGKRGEMRPEELSWGLHVLASLAF